MIIDFHTHVFPDKIAKSSVELLAKKAGINYYFDGSVCGLYKTMQEACIDIAVALPVLTKPTQFESVFNFALELNQRFEGKERKIISFAGIHPACENIDNKMALIKKSGFKGVKIHPDYQGAFIDDKGYMEILHSAKEYDLIVVTHAGYDAGYPNEKIKCPPSLVKKVIEKVKHEKFVLAHYGGNEQWQDVLKYLCDENVYFDTAYTMHAISEKLFKDILLSHGKDKILFATDCPWEDMSGAVNRLKSFELGKETEDFIFYKNAFNLLGI